MQEIFIPIPDFEDYQVSNTGKVISTKRNKAIELKPDITKHNHTSYARVTLSKEGKTYRFSIHRLVAFSFLDNPDNLPFINHIDNNGLNNNISNLEWCTQVENMKHSATQGRQNRARKLGCEAAALKNKEEMEAKFKRDMGSRFLGSKTEGRRRYVRYQCKYCNAIYTSRADLMPIKRNGICNSCAKEHDIVSSS